MTTQINNVMILGGRGNLGPYLIKALIKAGFDVSVLSRASSTATDETFYGAKIVKSDYTPESLVQVLNGQDAVISTLSTANIAEQKTIIDAVAAAKVKRFMPSEFGSDTSIDGLEKMAPFLKGKQDVMDYVKTKEVEGLTWTALFTGPWIDWMLIEGKDFFAWISIGEATAAALVHCDKTKNQYVHVSSYNICQEQVIEALERISGTKFALQALSNVDLYARGTKNVEEGNWSTGYYELATSTVYSDAEVTYFPDKAEYWKKVLGLDDGESLDTMITRTLNSAQ
ncbi:hypothetical protein NXS19_012796 [Fusarium pseudograminearum]|nr:hypothetical protein NXS19_012796 [Fusarium pseudograminearum]